MGRLFFTSLLVLTLTIITNNASRVVLKQNGYSDLVVAVSPDIPSNQSQLIIGNIQSMIRDASQVLFRATKRRAYFKNVNILVPSTWTNIKANPSTWEVYNKAEVKIAPASSAYRDTPYTIQLGGCGEPGDHIHLTPQYVATLNKSENVAMFGPAGKVFVHEWAHLRYGVFDEYGIRGDPSYPLFYRPQSIIDSSSIEPNLCSDIPSEFTTKDVATQGSCKFDPFTGLYDENCTFSLTDSFKPTTSLMSYHSVDSVVDFCDDGHNPQAPNKHNIMCNSRSVWSVIMDHQDFADDSNLPNNASDFFLPNPVFNVVRSSLGSRYVLLIDVSGSMSGNRIRRVYESARRWIRYDFPDGSELGIVEFNTRSSIKANLTLVNSVETRLNLMNKVPNYADGGTCIGCGLLSALLVLKESGPGGIIILVSDGEENDSPTMSDIAPFIIDAEVRVVSIAFGRQAEEKIENLSTGTDGKSYFVDDNDNSQGLSNAFIGTLIYEPALPSEDIVVKLFQNQYMNKGQSIVGNFSVDFSVGRETTIRLDYQSKEHIVSFSVISPDDFVYNNLTFDTVTQMAYFRIPNIAKTGVWRFSLVVGTSTSQSVAVLVTSRARSNTEFPITSRCYIPDGAIGLNATAMPIKIVSAVMQGRNPVLGANVKAYIKEPTGKVTTIDLFDNGVFGDTTRNDGVYSRYFVTATSLGRYSVECEISDGGKAYISESFSASSIVVKDPDVPYCCGSNVPVGGMKSTGLFTRVNSCGEFKITGIAGTLNDSYPPARVTDLQVISMNYSSMIVSIRFTAPGDELDYGTVSEYEIRYSSKFNEMTEDNFDIGTNSILIEENDLTIPGSLIPKSSGNEQIVTFRTRNETQLDTTYFIAMRAIDKANKTSPISNVASIQITQVNNRAQQTNFCVLTLNIVLLVVFLML